MEKQSNIQNEAYNEGYKKGREDALKEVLAIIKGEKQCQG